MSRLKWVSGEKQSPVDVGPVVQVGVQGEVGTAVLVYRHSVKFIGITVFVKCHRHGGRCRAMFLVIYVQFKQ